MYTIHLDILGTIHNFQWIADLYSFESRNGNFGYDANVSICLASNYDRGVPGSHVSALANNLLFLKFTMSCQHHAFSLCQSD